VLSLPSAGMLRHSKSRFLAEADGGFWVESAPGERALVAELIAQQKPCGISFKSGITKVVFATPIVEHAPEYRINAETVVEALRLIEPAEIKAVQRRNNYRVSVTGDTEMSMRVWRVAEKAYLNDRPMAAQEITARIRDLSLGGAGVIFTGKDGESPKVSIEDRLRIELHYGETTIILEGRMRNPTGRSPDKDKLITGIQFKALQEDLEGRQKQAQLTKIVGELQRAEVRRMRLGLTA
jgi:c-di-GMP-binding flagellar brake protein YcgR